MVLHVVKTRSINVIQTIKLPVGVTVMRFARPTQYHIGSAVALAIALISTPAAAQVADREADGAEPIVVTGTRIKSPGLTATSPIATTTEEQIKITRAVTVEDFSVRVPQLAGGVSSTASVTDSFGAQTLDLRGLGQNRTLVLINGTRAVPFSFRNAVDVSSIPATLLKRVDVLTGGAGAVYGADAMAGVVNFIINDQYRGLQASGNYRTSAGGGSQYGVNATFGAGLGDRGSIVGYAEYTKRDPLLAGKREFARLRATSITASAGGNFRDVASGRTFAFDEDGNFTLTPQRSSFTAILPLIQAMNRINASAFAQYELTDGIEAYGRVMFSRVESTGASNSGDGPAIFNGNVSISQTNPGLTPQASSLLTFVNGVANVNVSRSFAEFGVATATNTRTSLQALFGLRGNITPAINWDAYIQTGKVKDELVANNEGDRASFLASVASTDIFGPNPALVNFRRSFDIGTRSRRQTVASAYLSGDTSDFFTGWAGPIGFTAGVERRTDIGAFDYTQGLSALTFRQGSLLPPALKPKTVVNEVYGELLIPILSNLPLIQQFNIEGAFRRSWYTRADTIKSSGDTSKLGASWTISDDLRLRATRQIVIREPNIGEFANGIDGTRNFGTFIVGPNAARQGRYAGDPCVIANSGANLAQCARFGAPAVGSYDSLNPANFPGVYFIGGNPNIKPEKGKTFTIGGVATPSFIPGLSLSADYYNIRISDAVGVIQPIAAINSCYVTDPRADNPLCAAVTRNPVTGRIQDGFATDRNLGTLKQRGLDIGFNYGLKLGDSSFINKISFDYQAVFVLGYSIQRNATLAAIDCRGTYGATCSSDSVSFVSPDYRHRAAIGFETTPVTVQLGWTRIGEVRNSTLNALGTIPAYDYFDLNFAIRPPLKGTTLTFGINNIFNKQPPLPINGGQFGTFPDTYDVVGRSFGLTLTIKR
jgi:iron complex outermembrane recepter protein